MYLLQSRLTSSINQILTYQRDYCAMMRLSCTTTFILLLASTPGTLTAFLVPSDGPLTIQVHPFNTLCCEDYSFNKTVDILDLPETFVQILETQDTSLAIRESSLALRDTQPVSADSTTTATITSPIITLTMSCWGPSFTPVDGTTFHCSTTIPPISNFNGGSGINNGPTIMSSGTPVATITSPESTFMVMPPPSITSARSFTTTSNASTTIITPASDLTMSVYVNSTAYRNTTTSTSHFPTITLTSLTTVDPPSETNTIASTMSTASSTTTSASSNDAPQSAGQGFKIGYNKLGVVLVAGLTMNVILAAVL